MRTIVKRLILQKLNRITFNFLEGKLKKSRETEAKSIERENKDKSRKN